MDYLIVSAESVEDFWVFERGERLLHYHNRTWSVAEKLPQSGTAHRFIRSGENQFICALVDSAYSTHYYEFSGDSWHKMQSVADVPMRKFYRTPEGIVYSFGDWGRLLKFADGSWENFSTPFENHITAMTRDSSGGLWFGVRGEGVYRYYNGQYRYYSTPEDLRYDILQFKWNGNQLLLLGADAQIYGVLGDSISLINSEYRGMEPGRILNTNIQPGFFFQSNGRLYRYTEAKWVGETVPTRQRILSVRVFGEDNLLVTTRDGSIYIRESSPTLYFLDRGTEAYVEGNLLDRSHGAAFIDFNNDALLDLFVQNTGQSQLNRVYLNSGDLVFSEISKFTGLDTLSGATHFTFEDFTKDGLIDAVFATTTPTDNVFRFYRGLSGARFSQYSAVTLSLADVEYLRDMEWYYPDWKARPHLLTVFYYSDKKEPGTTRRIRQTRFGSFLVADTTEKPQFTGWNRNLSMADYDLDGAPDFFISNYWRENRMFLSRQDIEWEEYGIPRLDSTERTNTQSAISIDFDIDGDLDIIEQSEEFGVRLLRNISVSDTFRLEYQSDLLPDIPGKNITHLNSGDFNNDGFPDLLLLARDGMAAIPVILFNERGERFARLDYDLGFIESGIRGTIVGDVDNDGDLDIFGMGDGANHLWMNQLNTQTFLGISLQGSRSPTSGRGAKVWLYRAGFVGESEFLVGYQEAGTSPFENTMQNSSVLHFGLPDTGQYAVRVEFPGGTKKTIGSISAGSRITVQEYNRIFSAVYLLPGALLSMLRNPNLYYYGLLFLLAMSGTYLGTTFGIREYHWNNRLAVLLIIVNYTLFWVLVLILAEEPPALKFGVPLATVLVGHLLPLGLSYQVQRRDRQMAGDAAQEKLLELLRQFQHGEWALSTLNSLLLLTRNVTQKDRLNTKIIEQINDRSEAFRENISPHLREIFKFVTRLDFEPELIEDYGTGIQRIETCLSEVGNPELSTQERHRLYAEIAESILDLKEYLRELRETVFRDFSCDVIAVIHDVTEGLAPVLEMADITLSRRTDTDENLWALIPSYELAGIIDNCVTNAVKASEMAEIRRIEIQVKHVTPKIRILIKDYGQGIADEIREQVFESGFSTFEGTGFGLFQARKTLGKYGGRIEIHETNCNRGTTMLLELNEGVQP